MQNRPTLSFLILLCLVLMSCADGAPSEQKSPSDSSNFIPVQDAAASPEADRQLDPECGAFGVDCENGATCCSGFCVPASSSGRRVCTVPCDSAGTTCPVGWECNPITNGGPDRTFVCLAAGLTSDAGAEFGVADGAVNDATRSSDSGVSTDTNTRHPDIATPLTDAGGRLDGTVAADVPTASDPDSGADAGQPDAGAGDATAGDAVAGDALVSQDAMPSDMSQPAADAIATCIDGDGDGAPIDTAECRLSGANGPWDCDDANPLALPGADERCNGVDDNCDGLGDDFEFGLGSNCEVEIGNCRGHGRVICVSEREAMCNALIDDGSAEVCNGADDDCNGVVDDVPGVLTPCSVGIGQCQNSGIMRCDSVAQRTHCDAEPGAPTAERCDGLDNNCNGQSDEEFEVGELCSVGTGLCERDGRLVCAPDQMGTECDARPGSPLQEECNDLDDDCDGMIDEGFGLGQDCQVGVGVCTRSGVRICAPGQPASVCSVAPASPSEELCDGLDNDCNGEVDDGFGVGDNCLSGVGACARGGRLVCTADQRGVECNALAGLPSVEACDDVDNDCNGTVDDVADGIRWSAQLTRPFETPSFRQLRSYDPQLIYNGNHYFAIWHSDRQGGNGFTVLEEAEIDEIAMAVGNLDNRQDTNQPALAAGAGNGAGAIALTTGERSNCHVTSIITEPRAGWLTSVGRFANAPRLSWSDDRYGVLWSSNEAGNGGWRLAFIAPGGGAVAPAAQVPTPNGFSNPVIRGTPGGFALAWIGTVGGVDDVYFRRINTEGQQLSGDFNVSHSPWGVFDVAMDAGDNVIGVAWQERNDGQAFIRFQRVSLLGVKVGSPLDFGLPGSASSKPRVVAVGDRFVVAFLSNSNGANQLFAAVIDAAGDIATPPFAVTDVVGVGSPTLASNGVGFAVAWTGYPDGEPETFFAEGAMSCRIAPEGSCVPSEGGMEVCDGLDNDCDGSLDEDCAIWLDSATFLTSQGVAVALPAFAIHRSEVTVGAFADCVGSGACTPPAAGALCNSLGGPRADHPVNCISAEQARAYCASVGGRLPTNDEWERAFRGGLTGPNGMPNPAPLRTYPWGDQLPECRLGHYGACAEARLGTVSGLAKPDGVSPDGVHGLAGNLWEIVNPSALTLRGGGFESQSLELSIASRRAVPVQARDVGFRCIFNRP